jgi:hypothetical protein
VGTKAKLAIIGVVSELEKSFDRVRKISEFLGYMGIGKFQSGV